MPGRELKKKKYQVFVSSTFKDLQEHRQLAVLGIMQAGHIPVALENFAPSTASKKQVIRQALESSQFYVIILGARYGSIPPDSPDGKGYVEIELDMARELDLQILAFVMDMAKVIEIRKTDDFQKSDERKLIDKYETLRGRLTEGIENVFYHEFVTPSDIEKWILAYFNNLESSIRGYVLEPDLKDTEILRIYARNEIIRDVVRHLGQFSTVEPRLASEANKKIALGKSFADVWGDHIRNHYQRVFLESGSTITYVARELVRYLPTEGANRSSLEVITNNAFAYLYLWLISGILCHPVPPGPPDSKYGGMYGELTGRHRVPTYAGVALEDYDPEANEIIGRLSEEIFHESEGKGTLLLAAISGIQLTEDITAVRLDNEGKEHPLEPSDPRWEEVAQCRGLHVGSYENRLLKRSYYRAGHPAILFVHDAKIDCKIVVGECHFLCDSKFPWDEFARTYPLSVWVACSDDSYRKTLAKVRESLGDVFGWTCGVYGLGTPFPIIIASNEAFRTSCKENGVDLPVLPAGDL